MTPEKGLTSVIIPVYNAERFLAAALESVFRQNHPRLEILVIDDGSTDGSADLARSFPGVLVHHNPDNLGISRTRNHGLELARGEWIAFLDADDFWANNKLALQSDYLRQHPENSAVLGLTSFFAEPGSVPPPWLTEERKKSTLSFILGTLLAHRTVFDRVGNFNPAYRVGEDTDWFIRAHEMKIPIPIMPEVVLHKREHDQNITLDRERSRQAMSTIMAASLRRRRNPSPTPNP